MEDGSGLSVMIVDRPQLFERGAWNDDYSRSGGLILIGGISLLGYMIHSEHTALPTVGKPAVSYPFSYRSRRFNERA